MGFLAPLKVNPFPKQTNQVYTTILNQPSNAMNHHERNFFSNLLIKGQNYRIQEQQESENFEQESKQEVCRNVGRTICSTIRRQGGKTICRKQNGAGKQHLPLTARRISQQQKEFKAEGESRRWIRVRNLSSITQLERD